VAATRRADGDLVRAPPTPQRDRGDAARHTGGRPLSARRASQCLLASLSFGSEKNAGCRKTRTAAITNRETQDQRPDHDAKVP